jgi:hypothetical protein
MNSRQMQEAVEIELRQRDKDYEVKNKLQSKEIFYYLDRSQRDYVHNIYKDGIDKNEANKKKLGKLLISTILTSGIAVGTQYPKSYTIDTPEEILYVINERALITIDSVEIDDLYVKPISYDEYNVNKENPFRKSTDEKVLRLEGSNKHTILLPSEGTNVLIKVYLDYIKTPLDININQDCELHIDVHPNIIVGAAKLILGASQESTGYQIQDKEQKENK